MATITLEINITEAKAEMGGTSLTFDMEVHGDRDVSPFAQSLAAALSDMTRTQIGTLIGVFGLTVVQAPVSHSSH